MGLVQKTQKRYRRRMMALPAAMLLLLLITVAAYAAPANKTTSIWKGDTWRPQTTIGGNRTWTSLNPALASVNKKGVVRGLKAGTAVIQVSNGTQTQQFPVKILIPKLNDTSVRLKEDHKWTLSLSGLNASWSSGNKKIAWVSKNGVITAKRPGKVKIFARYGGFTYTCNVTVIRDTTIQKLTLNRMAMTLIDGRSGSLKLTVAPSRLQYLAKRAKWSSSNPKVAKVKDGSVKAVRPGTATITVKLQNITMACLVTVKADDRIDSLADLFKLDGKSGTYYLTKDLNLSDSTKRIKKLNCTLFGNGHTITLSDRSCLITANNGTVSNLKISGGALARCNYGTIEGCISYGQTSITVNGQIQYGFVEENRGIIRKCTNRHSFTVRNGAPSAALKEASMYIGGIALVNRGNIETCYNTAPLYSPSRAAGISVWNHGTIVNCMNDDKVDGKSGCGISYFNFGTLNNCLNTGRADYAFSVSSVKGTQVNCYYLKDMTKDKDPGADTPTAKIRRLTSAQMKSAASFPSFDFGSVWVMKKYWPQLR